MAIHPAQVPIINEVFTPSAKAVEHARAVVEAFAANPGAGIVGIGGLMYDRPHLARAEQLLGRAAAARGFRHFGDLPARHYLCNRSIRPIFIEHRLVDLDA